MQNEKLSTRVAAAANTDDNFLKIYIYVNIINKIMAIFL